MIAEEIISNTRQRLNLADVQRKPRKKPGATSQYYGAHLDTGVIGGRHLFMVRVHVGDELLHITRCVTELEAALYWDVTIRMLYDNPVHLNLSAEEYAKILPATIAKMQEHILAVFARERGQRLLAHPRAQVVREGLERFKARRCRLPSTPALHHIQLEPRPATVRLVEPPPLPRTVVPPPIPVELTKFQARLRSVVNWINRTIIRPLNRTLRRVFLNRK